MRPALPLITDVLTPPPNAERSASRKLKLLEAPVQRAPADAQFFRCLGAVTTAFIQCAHDQPDLIVVDVDLVLIPTFARSETARGSPHRQRKIPDGNLISSGQGYAGINCTLQFPDVSRPIIPQKSLHRLGRQRPERLALTL